MFRVLPLTPPEPADRPYGRAGATGGPADKTVTPADFVKRPISRREWWIAAILASFLLLTAAVVTPRAATRMMPIPGFIVMYATGMLVIYLLAGVLLLTKARIEKDSRHALLATAFVYAGLAIIIQLFTFPNGLMPGIILGVPGSATWMWVFWHGGFPVLVLLYTIFADRPGVAEPRVALTISFAVLMAGMAGFVACTQVRLLPQILNGNSYFGGVDGRIVEITIMFLNLLCLGSVVFKLRMRTSGALWLAVGMLGACVDVWLTLTALARFSLGWYLGRLCGLTTAFVLFASLLHDVLVTYLSYSKVAATNTVLDRLSFTDALTGLGNRRLFDDVIEKEWRRCRRDKSPLTIVMLDVDEFKVFNDTYGHQAGDDCLREIGRQLLAGAARPGDSVLRYGGEEFAMVLPATDSAGGAHLAGLLRARIRELAIPNRASKHKIVTVSAGLASMVPTEAFDMAELIKRADIALYSAKAAGRDKVMVAG